MTCLLRDRSAASHMMRDIFGDASLLRAALDYEAALARAGAAEGLISQTELAAILAACTNVPFEVSRLADDAAYAGTLAIPLVAQLRQHIAATDPAAAAKLHLGGTSQDLADTCLMLQAKQGAALIANDLQELRDALGALAIAHAGVPMLGRTLLQPALPMTFALKTAQWMLSIDGALARFERECSTGLALQFGGAAGTRAGLQGRGEAMAAHMAAALGLACPPAPWQSRRESIAGIAASLAIATGAIGKIARDVTLLGQAELSEMFEPRQPCRGGSSAMAHKRNATGCQVALSASLRAPGLCATILSALPQELERGIGGWQAEAPALADLFALAHGAILAMLPVLRDPEIDRDKMAENLEKAGVGSDTGESDIMAEAAMAFVASRLDG